mgnify:CR=1 FL=1
MCNDDLQWTTKFCVIFFNKYVIIECHKRNLELHAWFNLFRAVSHHKFSPPSEEHFAHEHPEWVYLADKKQMLDPGVPEARKHAVEVYS